jgi:hypothetical protein
MPRLALPSRRLAADPGEQLAMLARQFPQTLELLHPMKLALDLEQPLENTPGLEEGSAAQERRPFGRQRNRRATAYEGLCDCLPRDFDRYLARVRFPPLPTSRSGCGPSGAVKRSRARQALA